MISLFTYFPHAWIGDVQWLVGFRAEEGDDALRLILSSGRVFPDHRVAEADRLIDENELVEDVGAPLDVVFDHALLQHVKVGHETIEHGHAVRQT